MKGLENKKERKKLVRIEHEIGMQEAKVQISI